MAVIDGVILKGRHIVIPESLQKQALQKLYMEIEKKNSKNPYVQINILDRYEH